MIRLFRTPTPKFIPALNIEIRRASKIKIKADGKNIDNYTLEKTVENAVTDSGLTLSRLDKTNPDRNSPVQNGMSIIVTRINVEEVTQNEDIDFKTTTKTRFHNGLARKKSHYAGRKRSEGSKL